MKKRNFHVVKAESGWAVKQEGFSGPLSLHQTQKEAIGSGRGLAKTFQAELVIHGRKGRIIDKDSYGNDPFPPRDYKH